MFKKNMVLSILLTVPALALILNIALGVTSNDPVETPKDTGFTTVPLENLAADFRVLRKIKGHFDGGKWNDEVDLWMSRKHRLMLELGYRIPKGNYLKSDIIRLLDPPDQTAPKSDDLYRQITGLPGNDSPSFAPDEYLVYYWRGTHDFLYCACKGNTIVHCGWWHDWE
ncbi:MAG: hypothetical protein QG657_1936 [Acidobacteriota bacterium]|nr:hypothetical protein [Acidobacteriota bacterium]